jgi:hypothetical protein
MTLVSKSGKLTFKMLKRTAKMEVSCGEFPLPLCVSASAFHVAAVAAAAASNVTHNRCNCSAHLVVLLPLPLHRALRAHQDLPLSRTFR